MLKNGRLRRNQAGIAVGKVQPQQKTTGGATKKYKTNAGRLNACCCTSNVHQTASRRWGATRRVGHAARREGRNGNVNTAGDKVGAVAAAGKVREGCMYNVGEG